MPMPNRFKPSKYYRDRAEESRLVAGSMKDESCRRTWASLAAGWDALADNVDRKLYDLEARTKAALRATTGGSNALAEWERRQRGGDADAGKGLPEGRPGRLSVETDRGARHRTAGGDRGGSQTVGLH